MYTIFPTKTFIKSLKKIKSGVGGKRIAKELECCLDVLAKGGDLPLPYKDHALQGDLAGYREFHLRGDCLVVYKKEEKELLIVLIEIGSHSYLF